MWILICYSELWKCSIWRSRRKLSFQLPSMATLSFENVIGPLFYCVPPKMVRHRKEQRRFGRSGLVILFIFSFFNVLFLYTIIRFGVGQKSPNEIFGRLSFGYSHFQQKIGCKICLLLLRMPSSCIHKSLILRVVSTKVWYLDGMLTVNGGLGQPKIESVNLWLN